jgi:hypothetical protein
MLNSQYSSIRYLCLGSGVDLGVQLLLSLHGVSILVGRSSVALGIVQDLSSADGVFQALDLICE